MFNKSMSLSARSLTGFLLVIAASGCSKLGITSAVGPTTSAVRKAPSSEALKGIAIVDLDEAVNRRLKARPSRGSFADSLGSAQPVGMVVHPGDVLEVSIWEAPPATLFGSSISETRATTAPLVSRASTLPELAVGLSGRITIPFAGSIPVSGRTPQQIEADITKRLAGKAHLPQVAVRISRNVTSTATVVGEVATSTRMPLTPKGERLLDAIAQAGGTKQPIGKMTVQLTRGDRVEQMALEDVVREPRQNIILANGDVVAAIFQPYSFTVLGAAGKNEEINFEATGVTLAQALGRIGGLREQRADPKGVFVFRWEDRSSLSPEALATGAVAPDGKTPVIYRVNLKDPATFFLAQGFDIRNGDVVYISSSPVADFERFVNIVAQTVLPLIAVENTLTN